MIRRCVTKEECLNTKKPIDLKTGLAFPFFAFEGECRLTCPPLYDIVGVNETRTCKRCLNDKCEKRCPGGKIDSIQTVQKLSGCTYIQGSLEIQIRREGGCKL